MQRSEQILAARGSDHPNKVSIGVRMLATPTATGGTTYPMDPTPSPLVPCGARKRVRRSLGCAVRAQLCSGEHARYEHVQQPRPPRCR